LKISLITINYNNLRGLKATVESVVNSDGFPFLDEVEWIIVDGNSQDGSAEWLRENSGKFQQLIIEKDRGIYDAMNKGITHSTGDFLWFLNSGDRLAHPIVLGSVIQQMQSNPADVYFGDTLFVDTEGLDLGLISQKKPQPFPAELGPNSFRFGMNICHQSFIAKKELAPLYNTEYRLAADVDWVIQILKKKPVSYRFTMVVSKFEVGGSSYEHTQKAWKERYAILNKHYGAVFNFFAHIWIFCRRIIFNIKSKFG
jgi:glycosyltransferase involved in cell wall biosynthesis